MPTTRSSEDTREFFKRQLAKFDADKIATDASNAAVSAVAKAAVMQQFPDYAVNKKTAIPESQESELSRSERRLSAFAQTLPKSSSNSVSVEQDAPYAAPAPSSELWKKFGCDTEAGRSLRMLYYKEISAAGKKHSSSHSVRSSASSKFNPEKIALLERERLKAKKCPQRDGKIAVPKVGQEARKEAIRRMREEEEANRRPSIRTVDMIKKVSSEQGGKIMEPCPGPKGRDNAALKERLANQFAYGDAWMDNSELRRRREEREMDEREFLTENGGLGRADVEMLKELKQGIQDKEKTLKEIDERYRRNSR